MATKDALLRDFNDAKLPTATASSPAYNLASTSNPDPMYQRALTDSKTMEDKMKLALALDNLNLDLTDLQEDLERVTKWSEAKDHQVISGMASRKDWQTTLRGLDKELNEQRSIMDTFHYTEHRDSYDYVSNKFSNMQAALCWAIKDIEHEDRSRELYSERPVKAAPTKIPIFSGMPMEDLLDFQEKFKRAVEDTKVTKKNQPDKLREHLAGRALSHIHTSIKDIDYAWELLKEAFGDPMILLNYRMQAIRAMKPITEEQMNEQPLEAVDWFLDMERCIMELVKLGDRGLQVSYSAFGSPTISQIISLLPNHLENKIIGHVSEGRDKLMYTMKLMTDRRRICNKRGVSYGIQAIGGPIPSGPATSGHLSEQAPIWSYQGVGATPHLTAPPLSRPSAPSLAPLAPVFTAAPAPASVPDLYSAPALPAPTTSGHFSGQPSIWSHQGVFGTSHPTAPPAPIAAAPYSAATYSAAPVSPAAPYSAAPYSAAPTGEQLITKLISPDEIQAAYTQRQAELTNILELGYWNDSLED